MFGMRTMLWSFETGLAVMENVFWLVAVFVGCRRGHLDWAFSCMSACSPARWRPWVGNAYGVYRDADMGLNSTTEHQGLQPVPLLSILGAERCLDAHTFIKCQTIDNGHPFVDNQLRFETRRRIEGESSKNNHQF